ncbi:hypothetical protein AT705_05165 [Pseudoalteromonas rubra]|uniref:Conjugal transfer protein TraG n=2 Tax=Pseudoalteromonas rubra TaxID=43658 RepID=A0A0U3I5N6_9GAMM|nr:hypothetical protein AT705_05165 [Pseudoalteromonas rubra]
MRFRQLLILAFCFVSVSFGHYSDELPQYLIYSVVTSLCLIAAFSLLKHKWLFSILVLSSIWILLAPDIPDGLLQMRAGFVVLLGMVFVVVLELKYVRLVYGLSYIPPGWGTFQPVSGEDKGRFLSLWELATTYRFVLGGIFLGRPLPEHRLFGLFNRVKVGPKDDRHLLTIAGSRGGKGTAAIIPNLLLYPGSVIAIDPKGELASITASRRGCGSQRVTSYMGQNVFVFDPENSVPGFPSASWNPLSELNLDDPRLWAHVSRISAAIIPKNDDPNSAFFTNHARTLLTALIVHVLETESPEKQNLIYVRKLIMEGDDELYQSCLANGATFTNAEEALFQFMAQSGAQNGKIARAADSYIRSAPEQRSGVMGTLQEQTDIFDDPGLENAMVRSDFSLSAMKHSPTTVYLCIQSTSLSTQLVKILSVFIELSIVAFGTDKHSPKENILYIIDECYALGKNDSIDVGMGLFAGFGVTLWPVLQNIGQLKALYPNNYQTFMTNCRAVQFFNEQEPDTLKYIEEKSGKKQKVRPDGTYYEAPLLSTHALTTDYLVRDSRRQIISFQGRPLALLELYDYYKHFPKNWYEGRDTAGSTSNIILSPNIEKTSFHKSEPINNFKSVGESVDTKLQDNIGIDTGFVLSVNKGDVFSLKSKTKLTARTLSLPCSTGEQVVMEVLSNPNDTSSFGLKNHSGFTWNVLGSGGNRAKISKGRGFLLGEYCKIEIDNTTLVVQKNPYALKLRDGRKFILTSGCKLFGEDIPEIGNPSGHLFLEIVESTSTPKMLGLKNCSKQKWKLQLTNGEKSEIDINQVKSLSKIAKIDFGRVQASIVV